MAGAFGNGRLPARRFGPLPPLPGRTRGRLDDDGRLRVAHTGALRPDPAHDRASLTAAGLVPCPTASGSPRS